VKPFIGEFDCPFVEPDSCFVPVLSIKDGVKGVVGVVGVLVEEEITGISNSFPLSLHFPLSFPLSLLFSRYFFFRHFNR